MYKCSETHVYNTEVFTSKMRLLESALKSYIKNKFKKSSKHTFYLSKSLNFCAHVILRDLEKINNIRLLTLPSGQ